MSDNEITPSERRIRREIRAMVNPLAAATSAIVGLTATTTLWASISYLAFALICLARWQVERPRLDDDPEPFAAMVRTLPWMFLLVLVSASTLAVGSVTVVTHPDWLWGWAVLAVGIVTTVTLGVLIVIGRRNYDRAQKAAS